MKEHREKGKRYCCPEHAKRGAGHAQAVGQARNRALKATRSKSQERSRVQKAYRQLAMGSDSALGVIYNPVLRKRRRKLGLLHDPE